MQSFIAVGLRINNLWAKHFMRVDPWPSVMAFPTIVHCKAEANPTQAQPVRRCGSLCGNWQGNTDATYCGRQTAWDATFSQ